MLTAITNNWSNCTVLCMKKPVYRKRHDKLIFLHDNAPSHMSTMVQNYLETLHSTGKYPIPYSPDLASSDYHLFSSMVHALAEQHFDSYEDVRKWLDEFVSKDEEFFWRGIHKLPERWEKCIVSEGKYFEICFCFLGKKCIFLTKKTADLSLHLVNTYGSTNKFPPFAKDGATNKL